MTAPEAAGISPRDRVVAFHEAHYSANLMRLAVIGREVRCFYCLPWVLGGGAGRRATTAPT